MDLLDLPPELFTRIVTHLVTGAGVTEAWKCREVCRTFRRSIEFETFANQPVRAFLRSSDRDARTLLRKNLSLYLRYRSTSEKNAYSFVPRFVNRMADFVCATTSDNDHQTRKRCIRVICDLLLDQQKCSRSTLRPLNCLIETKNPEASSRFLVEVDRYHKDITSNYVAAAAAVGNFDALQNALKGQPDNIWQKSPVFGYPLVAAAVGQQTTIVRAIVKHFEFTQHRTHMKQHWHQFHSATDAAFKARNNAIALLLVRVLHAYASPIDSGHLQSWASGAMHMRDSILIHQVQKLRRSDVYVLKWFREACEDGDANAVRMFFKEGFVTVHDNMGYSNNGCTPLAWAVAGMGPAVIETILKMGAHPNGGEELSGFDDPLWEAVELNSESAVQLLLRYGADPRRIGGKWDPKPPSFKDSRSKIKKLLVRATKRGKYFVSKPRIKFAIDAPDLVVPGQTGQENADG